MTKDKDRIRPLSISFEKEKQTIIKERQDKIFVNLFTKQKNKAYKNKSIKVKARAQGWSMPAET